MGMKTQPHDLWKDLKNISLHQDNSDTLNGRWLLQDMVDNS